jgi:hypothetical protein
MAAVAMAVAFVLLVRERHNDFAAIPAVCLLVVAFAWSSKRSWRFVAATAGLLVGAWIAFEVWFGLTQSR